jgi:hypothetical protein
VRRNPEVSHDLLRDKAALLNELRAVQAAGDVLGVGLALDHKDAVGAALGPQALKLALARRLGHAGLDLQQSGRARNTPGVGHLEEAQGVLDQFVGEAEDIGGLGDRALRRSLHRARIWPGERVDAVGLAGASLASTRTLDLNDGVTGALQVLGEAGALDTEDELVRVTEALGPALQLDIAGRGGSGGRPTFYV